MRSQRRRAVERTEVVGPLRTMPHPERHQYDAERAKANGL